MPGGLRVRRKGLQKTITIPLNSGNGSPQSKSVTIYCKDEDTEAEIAKLVAIHNPSLAGTRGKQRSHHDGIVYFLYCKKLNLYKIGHSVDTRYRSSQQGAGWPYPVKFIAFIPGSRQKETYLHDKFSHLNVRKDPDWEDDSGRAGKEWFHFDESIVSYIQEYGHDPAELYDDNGNGNGNGNGHRPAVDHGDDDPQLQLFA